MSRAVAELLTHVSPLFRQHTRPTALVVLPMLTCAFCFVMPPCAAVSAGQPAQCSAASAGKGRGRTPCRRSCAQLLSSHFLTKHHRWSAGKAPATGRGPKQPTCRPVTFPAAAGPPVQRLATREQRGGQQGRVGGWRLCAQCPLLLLFMGRGRGTPRCGGSDGPCRGASFDAASRSAGGTSGACSGAVPGPGAPAGGAAP